MNFWFLFGSSFLSLSAIIYALYSLNNKTMPIIIFSVILVFSFTFICYTCIKFAMRIDKQEKIIVSKLKEFVECAEKFQKNNKE